jgi:RimJ/RimL family protein N-acetyltransferase
VATIPTLETARLKLRAFRADDIEAMAQIYADPDVARYITMDGLPQSRLNAWRSMTNIMGHWALRGFGMWAVELKAREELIGFMGPHFPESWPGQEIGWALAKAHWGRGYATEGVKSCLDYAFNVLQWDKVIHIINPANTRSIAVAEKVGATQVDRWTMGERELLIYGQANNKAAA